MKAVCTLATDAPSVSYEQSISLRTTLTSSSTTTPSAIVCTRIVEEYTQYQWKNRAKEDRVAMKPPSSLVIAQCMLRQAAKPPKHTTFPGIIAGAKSRNRVKTSHRVASSDPALCENRRLYPKNAVAVLMSQSSPLGRQQTVQTFNTRVVRKGSTLRENASSIP